MIGAIYQEVKPGLVAGWQTEVKVKRIQLLEVPSASFRKLVDRNHFFGHGQLSGARHG